jgi:hypothetical protein
MVNSLAEPASLLLIATGLVALRLKQNASNADNQTRFFHRI